MDARALFAIYFAGLVSMQFHPRNSDQFDNLDLMKFANKAMDMVNITMLLFPENV